MKDLFLRAVGLAPVARVVWAGLMVAYTAVLAVLLVDAHRHR